MEIVVTDGPVTVEGRSYEDGQSLDVAPNTAISLCRGDLDHRGPVAKFPDAETEKAAREACTLSDEDMPARRTESDGDEESPDFSLVDALDAVDGIGDDTAREAADSLDEPPESLEAMLDMDLDDMTGIGPATADDIRQHYE